MRRTLLQEAVAMEQKQPSSVALSLGDTSKSDVDSDASFFFFDNAEFSSDSTAHNEVRKYLEDSDINLKSLQAFPIVKRLKYNTTMPFSAPVERLFSHSLLLHYNHHHYPTDTIHSE